MEECIATNQEKHQGEESNDFQSAENVRTCTCLNLFSQQQYKSITAVKTVILAASSFGEFCNFYRMLTYRFLSIPCKLIIHITKMILTELGLCKKFRWTCSDHVGTRADNVGGSCSATSQGLRILSMFLVHVPGIYSSIKKKVSGGTCTFHNSIWNTARPKFWRKQHRKRMHILDKRESINAYLFQFTMILP